MFQKKKVGDQDPSLGRLFSGDLKELNKFKHRKVRQRYDGNYDMMLFLWKNGELVYESKGKSPVKLDSE